MREKQSNIRNILLLVMILAGATIFYLFYSQGGVTFGFSQEENRISLSGANETSWSAAFSDITDIELEENFEMGTAQGGGKTWQGSVYGSWSNESLGSYEAFLTSRVSSAIIIKTEEETIAFSLENTETMRSLYEQLYDYWNGVK